MNKSRKKPGPKGPDIKALVRRLADVEAKAFRPSVEVEGTVVPMSGQQMTDAPVLGTLGLVELKLTKAEEAVLSRAVNPDDVSIKPSGQPYLSHPVYTRWFNEAFGRTGWALVQTSMAGGRQDASRAQVVAHYTLFVHGKPVASAWGEQEYWSSNSDQSYGDALEATVASGLRRCAKRLGIGLELWDRRWLAKFILDHCVQVDCLVWDHGQKARVPKKLWRRKDDPALKGEYDARQEKHAGRGDQFDQAARPQLEAPPDFDESPARRSPVASTHAHTGHAISEKQQKRLFAILRNSGRNEEAFRSWLERRHGYTSTSQITRDQYDDICRAIESPKALPEK